MIKTFLMLLCSERFLFFLFYIYACSHNVESWLCVFFVDLIIYNGIMFAIGNVNALTVRFGPEPCFAT